MSIRISPYLIQLVYDAALKSFWRKKALRNFLRECSLKANFLSTWASDETKRDFLDRAFEALQKTEKGKMTIGKMAIFLSEQKTFPDLENWEDSSEKLKAARKSVNDLSQYLSEQNKKIIEEKEKEKKRLEAIKLRNKNISIQTTITGLREKLDLLNSEIGTQSGGYKFQDLFYELLNFCEIEYRKPYTIGSRQIDGSLSLDGTTYLIELKFTAKQSDVTDIDSLKAKIEKMADNTMGIMVSISGYSKAAINDASGKSTSLLLIDSSHLYLVLT